jgi:NADPH:quinone reductase-like Zn-dependent oxidoreductase
MMKALIRGEEGKSPYLADVPIPKPKKGQVLVRVEDAPIHPIDKLIMTGKCKTTGKLLGVEGSGQIIELGEGVPHDLLNKKIGFLENHLSESFNGSWAQFTIVDLEPRMFTVFDDKLDFSEIACSFYNPLTARGLFTWIQEGGHKSVVVDATSSVVVRILLHLLKQGGISTIGLVESNDDREELLKAGATVILNCKEEGFTEKFKKEVSDYSIKLFVDAYGGDCVTKIMKMMPEETHLINYGRLSGEDVPEEYRKSKNFRRFSVVDYHYSLSNEKRTETLDRIKNDITTGGSIYGTKILKEFGLKDWKTAFEEDSHKPMGEGKFLLRPTII